MDPNGKEIGGLVMIDNLGIRGLCFDSEEGYEAMCMGLIQAQPGVTFRHDWKDRITLGVVEGVASVVLHDAQGNPHLRLEVDKDGKTWVEGVTPTPASREGARGRSGQPALQLSHEHLHGDALPVGDAARAVAPGEELLGRLPRGGGHGRQRLQGPGE